MLTFLTLLYMEMSFNQVAVMSIQKYLYTNTLCIILWTHVRCSGIFAMYMCCDISNYFVKNAQFCHFLRGPCSFFTFSKLSKIAHFVTFWEAHVFFRFINFVKNAQFCHFLRGQCIFSHFQFCQKWSILWFLKSGLQIMR